MPHCAILARGMKKGIYSEKWKTIESTVSSRYPPVSPFESQEYRNFAWQACECVPGIPEKVVLGWTRGRVMEDVII